MSYEIHLHDFSLDPNIFLTEFLFDLEKDPSETYSYTRENPSVATRLRKLLEAGQEEFSSAVLPDMWNR